jgi:drug/metabolite transporter (DMT)-like permease
MQRKQGNVMGVLTILLMSSLALLSILTTEIPAFELTALAFSVASIIGLIILRQQNIQLKQLFKIELKVWIVSVYGLFGYHFFYFLAIKHAPAIEANLINYLWPLLIVLFSTFLPKEKLRWYHLFGSFLGLFGSYLIVSNGGSSNFQSDYILGYGLALLAAIIWSSYSVISKTFTHIPTYAVTGFCLVTAVLSSICHFIFETTVIPDVTQSIGILLLGLGPVGGAFYFWDHAVKNGVIKLIG